MESCLSTLRCFVDCCAYLIRLRLQLGQRSRLQHWRKCHPVCPTFVRQNALACAYLPSFQRLFLSKLRSTITATLPRMPLPSFNDCNPALIASTVLSMVWLICGTTNFCVAQSIARTIPRWRKALALVSNVVGSKKYRNRLTLICLASRSARMESTGLHVSTNRVVFPGPTPSTIQLPPCRTVFAVSTKLFSL